MKREIKDFAGRAGWRWGWGWVLQPHHGWQNKGINHSEEKRKTCQFPFFASSTNWTSSPGSRERSRGSRDSYVSCTRKRLLSPCRDELSLATSRLQTISSSNKSATLDEELNNKPIKHKTADKHTFKFKSINDLIDFTIHAVFERFAGFSSHLLHTTGMWTSHSFLAAPTSGIIFV